MNEFYLKSIKDKTTCYHLFHPSVLPASLLPVPSGWIKTRKILERINSSEFSLHSTIEAVPVQAEQQSVGGDCDG